MNINSNLNYPFIYSIYEANYPIFPVNKYPQIPMKETLLYGNIVMDTEGVLWTVYINENSLKNCLQLSGSFVHRNKKMFTVFGHFFPTAVHSVMYVFSSITKKPH